LHQNMESSIDLQGEAGMITRVADTTAAVVHGLVVTVVVALGVAIIVVLLSVLLYNHLTGGTDVDS